MSDACEIAQQAKRASVICPKTETVEPDPELGVNLTQLISEICNREVQGQIFIVVHFFGTWYIHESNDEFVMLHVA
jgi:hypothetical protein